MNKVVANVVGKKQLILLKTTVLMLHFTFTVALPVCSIRGKDRTKEQKAHNFSIVISLLGSCAASKLLKFECT